MNQRRRKPHNGLKLALAATALLALALGAAPAEAQQVTTLIQFTNVWKYDQSGLELGTAWRTNDYDDSAWASGPGLFGFEVENPEVYTVQAPIQTPLILSTNITTYYFRTTFPFSGSTDALKLVSWNLVDDGCMVYLNGLRAGGVRVSPAYTNDATAPFGSIGPLQEGRLDMFAFTNLAALRQGENLLAVEVHQTSQLSSDVMWGMQLLAVQETAIVITNQPQSQTALSTRNVTLTVGHSGGPAVYRWQISGLNISGATNASLVISSVQSFSSGQYRVIVTNAVSAVTSEVATLTVIQDLEGPRLTGAVIDGGYGPDIVIIRFDERLAADTGSAARDTNSYLILSTTDPNVKFTAATIIGYNPAIGIGIRVAEPGWDPGGSYYLTVSGVQDRSRNSVAPNSRIGLSHWRTTNLISTDSVWDFHSSAGFDPGVFEESWTAPGYAVDQWWSSGRSPFSSWRAPAITCFEDAQTRLNSQPVPTLFRTPFVWPSDWRPDGRLAMKVAAKAGVVLFLNGAEIYRTNVVGLGDPVGWATRALSENGSCSSNIMISVTNLLSGTNWLAAAVIHENQSTYASPAPNLSMTFALQLTGHSGTPTPFLAEDPPPILNVSQERGTFFRLSWTGGGFALEASTNLNSGWASYPHGPWIQVTNMSNPYTNRATGPRRFFRLKR